MAGQDIAVSADPTAVPGLVVDQRYRLQNQGRFTIHGVIADAAPAERTAPALIIPPDPKVREDFALGEGEGLYLWGDTRGAAYVVETDD